MPVVLLVVATTVRGLCAPGSAIDLTWEAPHQCPTAQVIREEILRLVAPRVEFSSPIEATAHTRVDERGRFVLRLETRQAGIAGERIFSGQHCKAVADAAIVTLALSLDPNLEIPREYRSRLTNPDERDPSQVAPVPPRHADSTERAAPAGDRAVAADPRRAARSDPTVTAEPRTAAPAGDRAVAADPRTVAQAGDRAVTAEPRTVARPNRAVAAPSKPNKTNPEKTNQDASSSLRSPPALGASSGSETAKSPTSGFVRAAFGWRWGALPESAPELGIGFGLQRSRWLVLASFSFSPTTKLANSADYPNAGGRFSMLATEANACWALLEGSVRIAPCLGIAFTYLNAEGVGVRPLREGKLYWTSPLFGLQLNYRLSQRLALFGGLAGYWAARRPEAYLNQGETLFTPANLTFLAAGGAEVKLW